MSYNLQPNNPELKYSGSRRPPTNPIPKFDLDTGRQEEQRREDMKARLEVMRLAGIYHNS